MNLCSTLISNFTDMRITVVINCNFINNFIFKFSPHLKAGFAYNYQTVCRAEPLYVYDAARSRYMFQTGPDEIFSTIHSTYKDFRIVRRRFSCDNVHMTIFFIFLCRSVSLFYEILWNLLTKYCGNGKPFQFSRYAIPVSNSKICNGMETGDANFCRLKWK